MEGIGGPLEYPGLELVCIAYQIGQTIAGVSDTITLAAKGASNGDDICGTLKWVDLT